MEIGQRVVDRLGGSGMGRSRYTRVIGFTNSWELSVNVLLDTRLLCRMEPLPSISWVTKNLRLDNSATKGKRKYYLSRKQKQDQTKQTNTVAIK